MKTLNWVVFILVIVGALNWGLVGLFNFDLVASIFGVMTMASRVIYTLVGLSAIIMLFTCSKVIGHKCGM